MDKASLSFKSQRYKKLLINNGTYAPGQKLSPEAEFALQLDISGPALQEVLEFVPDDFCVYIVLRNGK